MTMDPCKQPEERPRPKRSGVLHRFLLSDEVFGTSMSVLLHLAVILILAMFFSTLPPRNDRGLELIIGIEELGDKESEEPGLLPVENLATENENDDQQPLPTQELAQDKMEEHTTDKPENDVVSGIPTATETPREFGAGEPPKGKNASNSGRFAAGGGLTGRTAGNRGRCMNIGETTGESEEAVERALKWMAAHQCPDGGWNFDLSKNDSTSSGCGLCANGGDHGSRIAATSIVLLAYLGAGYTADPKTGGQHWKTVDRGLVYLVKQGRPLQQVPPPALPAKPALPFSSVAPIALGSPNAPVGTVGSIDSAGPGSPKRPRDDSSVETIAYIQGYQQMYSQGIAALALCEAHAMQPRVAILKRHARGSVEYIMKAQDMNHSGGWRYTMKQTPGDLSVTGWQVMALKSASLAEIDIPKPTLYRVGDFLDLLEFDNGRRYDYIPKRTKDSTGKGEGPDSEKTCTAIGLLCRMYLGWQPGEPKLDAGMELLQEWGPFSPTFGHKRGGRAGGEKACNLYYAYYATLAMHHYGGSGWRRWYPPLRDHLVATQSRRGHENGSWHVPDHYCDTGGRLLNTALATMILEMPYRYMPLFSGEWRMESGE